MNVNKPLAIVSLLAIAAAVYLSTFEKKTAKPKASIERQLTMLALERAEEWPVLLPEEVAEIEDLLFTGNEGAALERTKEAVYDGVSRRMQEDGRPIEEGRWGWYCNNRATALLFIDHPLAKRLGREQELIDCRREDCNWWSVLYGNATREEYDTYSKWHGSGVWPFQGEPSPIYVRMKK